MDCNQKYTDLQSNIHQKYRVILTYFADIARDKILYFYSEEKSCMMDDSLK